MKVLHAISTLSPRMGGPPVAVMQMARALVQTGHEVSVHATDADDTGPCLRVVDGVRVLRHAHAPWPIVSRHASLAMYRALEAEISAADLVHLHSLYMFHDWAVWRICRRAGVPYILQPHGALDPLVYRHHRWRKRWAELAFQDRVTSDAALILYTSEAERELGEPYTFRRPGAVVPLAIDAEQFAPRPPSRDFCDRFRIPQNRRVVLFLGRLNFKKGLDLLIPAFAMAAASRNDLHLVLAGPAGDAEREARMLVTRHQLSDRVTFTGHLDREQVREAFAAATIFALPSRTENFAIAAAEAMAAGVTTLLSDQVQIAPAAAARGACLMLPLSAPAWTAALLGLFDDPAAMAALRHRARVYARATFAWRDQVPRLVEVYRNAVATAASREKRASRIPARRTARSSGSSEAAMRSMAE